MIEQLSEYITRPNHCVSVSGPNNCGKSNLLRQVAQSSTALQGWLKVYIDFNLRADNSAQAFYELILRQVLQTFREQSLDLAKLSDYYAQVSDPQARPFAMGQSFLAGIDAALHSLVPANRCLLLLLDEFDQPLRYLPGLTLLQLRAIKDHYCNRLGYVVATSRPILTYPTIEAEVETEAEGLGEFVELFSPAKLFRLGGFNRLTSDQIASAVLGSSALTSARLEQLFDLAGGHPGLTLHLSAKLARLSAAAQSEAEIEYALREDSEIELECRRIWQSLAESERTALLQHLEGIQIISATSPLGTLTERGLLTPGNPHRIFARTFEWFVRKQLETVGQTLLQPQAQTREVRQSSLRATTTNLTNRAKLAYDPRRESLVSLDLEETVSLNGNAALLFKYLFMRQSEPCCTKDELITAIWGNGGYSTENLDKLVSDLRHDIGDYDKQIIRTIPRRGLQMVGVIEWRG